MALTASYIAACMMAKLRVGWMVAGCAPGVRTITRSVLFHSTTWLAGFVAWAIAGARFAAASTAAVVPASKMGFMSDLTQLDAITRGGRPGLKDQRPTAIALQGRLAGRPPPRRQRPLSPFALFQTEPYLPVVRRQCHSALRSFAVTRNKL